MEVITRTKYPENKRFEFLTTFIGRWNCVAYENMAFDKLREASNGQYHGGYWEFYTLSNGGFYMELKQDEALNMECVGNYYQGTMSEEAASIAINLVVQNAFAWQVDAEKHSEHFYQLRDFASQHEEAAQIFAFID
ncbi:MAG: antirestriction protein [Methylomarinum sp.]|nr:antirestriction protein [Methylomarinum sp.]